VVKEKKMTTKSERAIRAVEAAVLFSDAEQLNKQVQVWNKGKGLGFVTSSDFASQIILCSVLDERIHGEETGEDLNELAGHEQVLAALQRRGYNLPLDSLWQRPEDPNDFWCADPIEGTKYYIKGDTYCSVLGRIRCGKVAEVYLCSRSSFVGDNRAGVTVISADESGTYLSREREALEIREPFLAASIEWSHLYKSVAKNLGLRVRRQIGQFRYSAVALGDAPLMLNLSSTVRPPTIWDHLAALLIESKGGIVTDFRGNPLTFDNSGVLKVEGGIVGALLPETHRAALLSLDRNWGKVIEEQRSMDKRALNARKQAPGTVV